MGPAGSAKTDRQITRLTSSLDTKTKLSIYDISDRIAMLGDVTGRVALMKRDMAYPDHPYGLGPLYGTEFDPQLQRKIKFLIAHTRDLPRTVSTQRSAVWSKRSNVNWRKDAGARSLPSTPRNTMSPSAWTFGRTSSYMAASESFCFGGNAILNPKV